MKRALLVIALAVLAVAAWWFVAPYLVVHHALQAAQGPDSAALDAYVDYPALRENLRGQVSATIDRKMGDAKDNPLAAIGSAIGRAVAGPMIDAVVQPGSVAASLRNGRWEAVPVTDTKGDVAWSYEHEGFDKFVARSTDSFVFVRHGFSDWKLSEIRLASR